MEAHLNARTNKAERMERKITKSERKQVYEKCNGHCAYCGKSITRNELRVDHVHPLWRGTSDEELVRMNLVRGAHDLGNWMPSCNRCNVRKSTFTVEKFRVIISKQAERLKKYESRYRMALDYGLIVETNQPVVFYFELNQTPQSSGKID